MLTFYTLVLIHLVLCWQSTAEIKKFKHSIVETDTSSKELKKTIFKKKVFGNKVLNLSTLALLLVQVLFFLTPAGSIFGLVAINLWQFLAILGVNIVGFFLIELLKPAMAKTFID